ncbi:hypothetical protein HMY34_08900 [Thiothrix subterranea]|uniref:hypothetical protein n=1 Tax=Thiothrix subterranea TaxID=2735563 RepID=UPI00192AE131|nr:hypothetical protein [Thiothrix subterranea]QQZ28861.1 hypothetical protein HMY34_08900 [Thiothrix subterranea]
MIAESSEIKRNLLIMATICLLLGIAVYLFLYPNKFQSITIPFIGVIFPKKIMINNQTLMVFIYSFTSFLHVIFMTLFCSVISTHITPKIMMSWGVTWGVIDSVFEFYQIDGMIETTSTVHSYIMEQAINYLNLGVYNKLDIVSIWIGVLFVFLLTVFIKEDKNENIT